MGQEKWAHVNFGVRFHPLSLQEKSLLASTKVDAKDKMLLQKTFFASTKRLPHSNAINRIA